MAATDANPKKPKKASGLRGLAQRGDSSNLSDWHGRIVPFDPSKAFRGIEIKMTPEWQRINDLPRREWNDKQAQEIADHYTSRLRTLTGTMRLRPLQGIALYEIETQRGLVGAIGVGRGKTLISMLAATILGSNRPLLLLPANLIVKTQAERRPLEEHWQISRSLKLLSYEMLSRDQSKDVLEQFEYDCIIADEGHRLKSPKSGATRRIKRYLDVRPSVAFVVMSGTLIKDDIRDFAHLTKWALRSRAPVPLNTSEADEWARCLGKDDEINPLKSVDPGPLLLWAHAGDESGNPRETARRAFRRRMSESYGVVTTKGDEVGCSITLNAHILGTNVTTHNNFTTLRHKWETPDGYAFGLAIDYNRYAKQLALGFHYIWNPRPPDEWMYARKEWAKFVRATISHSRHLDTEYQIKKEVLEGKLDPTAYNRWSQIEPVYKVTKKYIWHDDSAANACMAWAKQGPGIIWVHHAFFARELSRRSGIRYFGAEGICAETNENIIYEKGNRPIIASVKANCTGKNLQCFERNLIPSPPASGLEMEQLIARTHREGTKADTVIVDLLIGCRENYLSLLKSLAAASMTEQIMGQGQKLLLADKTIPDMSVIESYGERYHQFAETVEVAEPIDVSEDD